jgi:hypothetical protein
MSIKVTCAKCGARLVYKGTATMVKPCPKCQTPIAFIPTELEPAPSPAITPIAEEPIAAVAVEETRPQPAAAPKEAAAAPAKRSAVALIVLGGLAAAFGGLFVLVLACGGIAVFLLSSDRKESLASDSKGQSYSAASDLDYSKGGSDSSYSPTYTSTESPYSYSPASSEQVAASPASSEQVAAAAQSEKARLEEEQRRYAEEYWAQRDAEEAAARAEAEEAHERYMEAFRESIRMREAYP